MKNLKAFSLLVLFSGLLSASSCEDEANTSTDIKQTHLTASKWVIYSDQTTVYNCDGSLQFESDDAVPTDGTGRSFKFNSDYTGIVFSGEEQTAITWNTDEEATELTLTFPAEGDFSAMTFTYNIMELSSGSLSIKSTEDYCTNDPIPSNNYKDVIVQKYTAE